MDHKMSNTGNSNCFNVCNSYNNITYTPAIDERAEILSWISPLEPLQRHQDVRTKRVNGVGAWFLNTTEFRTWYGESEGCVGTTLFCLGVPGAGKTFMNSLVVDTILDTGVGNSVGVACLYCDFLAQNEQVALSVIGALLKQFVLRLPEIPEEICSAFQDSKENHGGRGLGVDEMIKMFRKVLGLFQRVFICIDALDELQVKQRLLVLRFLRQVLQDSPHARLFLTGRPHIQAEIGKHLTLSAIVITMEPSENDVRKYLISRLEDDPDPEAMNDDLKTEIMTKVPKAFSEIFLLVTLQTDAILGETTISGRREQLNQMVNGLGDAYGATLERIRQQPGSRPTLGLSVLMWVSLAERPLRADELCHALGVKVGTTDLDRNNIPAIQTLLGCCLGLITVDKETSTVRLVHSTLQEYLRAQPDIFRNPHAKIAQVCLTYLNFDSVRCLPSTLRIAPSTLPFAEYASCYWGLHAKKELTTSVKSLALTLLYQYPRHVSASISLSARDCWPWWIERASDGFTGLHCAASLGIHKLVNSLMEKGTIEIDSKDALGHTPLTWAARNGEESVVELLLGWEESGAKPADTRKRTRMKQAARSMNIRSPKTAIDRVGVDSNSVDEYNLTPLSWAAENGHEQVVRMLLAQKDINPDSVDALNTTPLSRAVKNGHIGIAKLLLSQKGVHPDRADLSYGRTPLSWAAQHGHQALVKLLIGRSDVKPDSSDKNRRTPLSWAAENGCEGIVRLLLDLTTANPDSTDNNGQIPLWWAVRAGHEGVVKLLLERTKLGSGSKKVLHRTLSFASEKGHEGVVKLLLDRNDVGPDLADGFYGRTPLAWAALNGHEGTVKTLLNRDDVNPNSIAKGGPTPLHFAVVHGHERVVKLLLDRKDIKPNLPDGQRGQTPLSLAAMKGREGIVRLLLAHKDVFPEASDTSTGRTPLAWASLKGHQGIVTQLLQRRDVDPNSLATDGSTPLHFAATNGHKEIVTMLLERKDIRSNVADRQVGHTPLSLAAMRGHGDVTKLLLAHKDVKPNKVTIDNRTPLDWAIRNKHHGVAKILEHRLKPGGSLQVRRSTIK